MYRRAIGLAVRLALFVAVLFPMSTALAQGTRGVVTGTVVEDVTGQPLAGVAVLLVATGRGALTDDAGRFALADVPAGAYTLRAQQLGYATVELPVEIRGGVTRALSLRLVVSAVRLSAVQARARSTERERFESRTGVGTVALTPSAVRTVPSFGEPDVLRTVQLLPGVNARNDFSSGYNVRGGESDQNLILLDGYPIYNPFHLGGLFSTFLDETVGSIELLTGGFGAAYGGRLSSVLDVRSTEATRTGVHGTAAISLISSSLSLGGASADGRSSWMVAGRRTYADKLVSLLSDRSFPYHFSDAQLHAVKAFDGDRRVELTAYSGADLLDGDLAALSDSAGTTANAGAFVFGWKNQLLGATLRDTWRPRDGRALLGADSVTAEQRVSYTKFATALDIADGVLALTNTVREVRLAGDVRWHRGNHERRVGYDASRYSIRYDVGSVATGTQLLALAQQPMAGALYYQESWHPGERLVAEAGVRAEHLTGRGWSGLSPRAQLKLFVTRDLALSVAAGEYAQWLHSLNREDIPNRLFDFWVASDEYVEVSRAKHLVLGAEQWLGPLRFARLELWGKKYDHLLEQNTADNPDRRGDEFLDADGLSYGVDLLVRQLDIGRFGGWIAYTYAVSGRSMRDVAYWPGHDRRHNLNLVGTWKAGEKYTMSARLGVASGTPYTDIVGEVIRRIYDPNTNSFGTGGPRKDIEPVGGRRNGSRYPLFQRLDLGVSRAGQWRGMQVTPYFSVVNAYNAKNVFIYNFDYRKSPATRETLSQFPLLPSIGMTVAF
ncbi:MAG: TonB-dependent receptor [Gemmatimonadaceae bacterium]|nr:TonB-dependent receptor [Gemmatimonadaceae bacterium]